MTRRVDKRNFGVFCRKDRLLGKHGDAALSLNGEVIQKRVLFVHSPQGAKASR